MKVIVAVDDDNGMMFNHRRQSQDRLLREHMLVIAEKSNLWINEYSSKQFESNDKIHVSNDFMNEASEGDYCFVEDQMISQFENKIEEMIIFKWNRRYPGDVFLDFFPVEHNMKCVRNEDFAGSSHDKISMEVWVRDGV